MLSAVPQPEIITLLYVESSVSRTEPSRDKAVDGPTGALVMFMSGTLYINLTTV